MSRDDIFYWKCDCSMSLERKQQSYFALKYDEDTVNAALQAAYDFAGSGLEEFDHLGVDGNHYAYRLKCGGKTYFLRTDNGHGEDDYMLAESAVLQLLAERGMPVPVVHKTDVSMDKHPFRYQILDFFDYPPLIDFYKKGELNREEIAKQSGRFLAQLHEVQLPGFGFINTDELASAGRMYGIDVSWKNYFYKRLDSHLGYLRDHDILAPRTIGEIETIFERNQSMLRICQGSLLHRDFALWNILGGPDRIVAVIDWDDTVIGDPADDIAVVNCFNDKQYMEQLLRVYGEKWLVDEIFRGRVSLYTLRNMLWKTMIRHYMGYFERDNSFFLSRNDEGVSLREYSLNKINTAIMELI